MSKELSTEDPSVSRFREYLRFPSVHPNPDYSACIQWLKNQAHGIGLDYTFVEFPKPAEFTIMMTWKGQSSNLKSILLNSHIDVVPINDPTSWIHPPFAAEKDEFGNIHARGSQDMKCVGVQYLEAIRRLKSQGFVPLRNIHLSFVPDEEVGGNKGMRAFVESLEFRNLNVGFTLDEGIASPDDSFNLFYAERCGCPFTVTATGKTGHASMMFDDTAAEKLQSVINKMLTIRTEQKTLMEKSGLELGAVTSVNMTMLGGGVQTNVVPSELWAVFEMRIAPTWNLARAKKLLDEICAEAGPGVTYEFRNKSHMIDTILTSIGPENIWWTTFKNSCDNLGIKIKPQIFPAATDSRFIRNIGIPAFGFSPMNNTPVLLHDKNEFLNENVFLKGIQIYEEIIKDLTNVPVDLE